VLEGPIALYKFHIGQLRGIEPPNPPPCCLSHFNSHVRTSRDQIERPDLGEIRNENREARGDEPDLNPDLDTGPQWT